MPTEIAARYPVYRHGSDVGAHDCGRACAQMVIASIVLGAQASPPNAPVPETQQSLRAREPFDASNPGMTGPGGWDTFPDELVDVLNNSADLMMAQNGWFVAHHRPTMNPSLGNDPALQNLLADIVAGLRRGRPSILNVKVVDHWVVVSKAFVDNDGGVQWIQLVDPAGLDSGITGAGHKYQDICQDEGTDYWSVWTPVQLGGFELKVGTVPPPTYAGEYVAIVPAPIRRPGWIKETIWSVASIQKALFFFWRRPMLLAPSPAPVSDIRISLRQTSVSLGLNELKALLDADPDVVSRYVKDLDATGDQYLLASLFDAQSGRGLIGVFNAVTNRVSRFRLTHRSDLHHALAGVTAADSLWWTRRKLRTWSLPYYPFQKTEHGYARLVDGDPLVFV